MSISTEITATALAQISDAEEVTCLVGPADAVQDGVGQAFVFYPGDNVYGTPSAPVVGACALTRIAYWHLRNSGALVIVAPAASTGGSLSAVTHTGSGPTTVTCSGTPTDSAMVPTLTITQGGPLGSAVAAFAADGFSQEYSYTLPPQGPAVLVGNVDLGTVDIADLSGETLRFLLTPIAGSAVDLIGTGDLTALTYATPAIVTGTQVLTGSQAALNTETIVGLNIDGAGAETVTFSTGGAGGLTNPASVAAQINAVFPNAAIINGSGHLVLTGVTLGTSGSIVIASGSALTALGLTAATTDGINASVNGQTLTGTNGGNAFTVTFGQVVSVAALVAAVTGANVPTTALYDGKFLELSTPAGPLVMGSGTSDTHLGFTNGQTAPPSSVEVLFASPVVAADLATQGNLQMAAAGLPVTFEVDQSAAGAQFLRVYTTGLQVGPTVTLAADATGSAMTAVGLTGTSTGTVSQLVLPYTGLTWTFPAGLYVALDTYSVTGTAPSSSIAALMAAATAARNAISTNAQAFARVEITQPADTASNAVALDGACESLRATWWTDPNAALFADFLFATPLGAKGNAASMAGPNANDAAVAAAFSTAPSSFSWRCHGDGYMTGSSSAGDLLGSFRRPAVCAVGMRRSKYQVSEDAGYGYRKALEQWSATGPDGVTKARVDTDPQITLKMGGSKGPGFTTLTLKGASAVYVTHGVTAQGQAVPYVHGNNLETSLYLATILRAALGAYENGTPPLNPAGQIMPPVVASYNQALTAIAQDALLNPPSPQAPYCSSVTVTVDGTEINAETDHMTATAEYQPLGNVESITLIVNAAGIVSLAPSAG